MSEKPTNVTKDEHDTIYWVERKEDEEIFSMNEQEVKRRFYENTSIYNWTFELIGVTDGSLMREYMQENNEKLQELQQEKSKLDNRLDRYIEKQDELLFDELVDDDNEKLQKVERRIDETRDKIKDLQEEIGEIQGNLYKKAREKELEKAREVGGELPDAPSNVLNSSRNTKQEQDQINQMLNHEWTNRGWYKYGVGAD